ncbi:MAG: hypothetical protein HKN85_07495 [Gammaproteobacteria bacterium]|nr:hypothetical protein [Gammaproteobacteria bacterium]
MEEKRKNLKSTQRREVIDRIMASLASSHPSFYYLSTIEIAAEIKAHVHKSGNLSNDDYLLLKDLSRRDIQIMLSMH